MLSNNVDIQYVRDYRIIKSLIQKDQLSNCFTDLKLKHPVSLVFMSDDELLNINREVLNHDYYTDVITFDYDDPDIEFNEILISVDRIIENAKQMNDTLYNELHRICIHGLLHLAGFDDQTALDKQKMTELENHYLDLYCST